MADMPDDAREAADRLGGHECCMCSIEIRQLSAVAHNLVVQWKDPGRRDAFINSLHELESAVAAIEPLAAAHFAALKGK